MKRFGFILVLIGLAAFCKAVAQVKIGTNSAPRAGAILDLNSELKGGLLLSVVELTSLTDVPHNETDPAHAVFPGYKPSEKHKMRGALVYNRRDDPANKIRPGVYYWDGERWIRLRCG